MAITARPSIVGHRRIFVTGPSQLVDHEIADTLDRIPK